MLGRRSQNMGNRTIPPSPTQIFHLPGRRLRAFFGLLSILAAAHIVYPTTARADTPPPAPFDPYHRAGAELLLPILDFQGQDDVCESWIDVQNLGADDARVALVTWGEPGFCPPQSAGPLKVECSGALPAGGTWTFSGPMVPTGSKGGVLLRFGNQPYTPPWPDAELQDDWTMAGVLCDLAFFGLLGDADDSRRFLRAYRSGLLFDGIDFAAAAGSGQLSATVTRRCPGFRTRGADTTTRYNAVALNRVGDVDPVQGGYVVFAPDAHVVTGGDGAPGVDGGTTMLYVQNAGLSCAMVDVWFAAHDGCGRARLCDEIWLAPLETLHFDAADCGPPNAAGAMWVRATQPVAVVAERILGDERSTYAGVPSTLLAAFDPAREAPRPTGPTIAVPYASNGNDVGDDDSDRARHIVVLNAHPSAPARIRLTLLDPSGAVRTSLTDWLCPRGSATYDLAVIGDLPVGWHGAARIVALEGGASLGGEAMLAGGAEGSGLIALPSVQRALDGRSTMIVIHNAVAAPGFTALRTGLFDANGLVQYVCSKLSAGEQTEIDLDALAYLGAGFRGAAVVSAWYWDHGRIDADDEVEAEAANRVQLTALTVMRGVDLGGATIEASAGTVGIPLRRREIDREGHGIWWLVAGSCDGEVFASRASGGADGP